MSEPNPERSKKGLFQLQTKSENGIVTEIWKLQPEYWTRFPYLELRNPSRAQLATFEDLLLGIQQDTGKAIPKEANRFAQFLDAQRSVQPRDGLSAAEFLPPGQHKRFEPNDRGAYFELDFLSDNAPFGAQFVDNGPESVQLGTAGFHFLSQDIDAEIPDQEIRVNKLHPNPRPAERIPLVVTGPRPLPGNSSPSPEPTYVDIDSIKDPELRRRGGVRNAQAEKALHIIHEFGHLTVDEGPLAAHSPLAGHITPYQRILDGHANEVAVQDILADPVERFTLDVGLTYGYITNERQYLKSRVDAYQERLTKEDIRNGDDLRKVLERADRRQPDKNAQEAMSDRAPAITTLPSTSQTETTTESAKMRLAVSKGTLTLQSLVNDEWQDTATQPAGKLRAGYYSLSPATAADPSKSYAGMTLYADDRYVYQKVGTAVIKHDRDEFALVPNPGEWQQIAYRNAQAVVSELPAQARGKSLTL